MITTRYLSVPPHLLNLLRIRKKIFAIVGELQAEMVKSPEPIPFDELSSYEFTAVKAGKKWANRYGCAWFRFTGHLPEGITSRIVALVNVGGEGAVYTPDGKVLQGITIVQGTADALQSRVGKQIVDLSEVTDAEGNICFYVDAGNNRLSRKHDDDVAKLENYSLAVINEETLGLYYDYLTLYMLALKLERGDRDYYKFGRVLATSFLTACKNWSPQNVKKARTGIQAVLPEVQVPDCINITAIGHAHLDLAWLWPIRETKRKAVRTLTNAFANLEKYPDFIMGISQPQQIEWMRQEYPEIYEKFREYVAAGRIEPQGGMWVESDCNLTSGESLVRQFLYGKRYWRENFDRDVKVCWLPDAFGFSGQLPQIMTKCGIENFFTIKLTWNRVNEFPFHSFNWEGIDGTKVLAHIAPQGDYNSTASPLAIAKTADLYKQKQSAPECLIVYGPGDGGGGPGEFSLEVLRRVTKLPRYHNVRQNSSEVFFDRLREYRGNLPTYKGELYLEMHQGTYTSQARNKAYNRRMEYLLHNVELLGTISPAEYPKDRIDAIWQEVLLYQFHDILPGSSIGRVYRETNAAYERMLTELREIRDTLLAAIGASDLPSAVNYTPYRRQEWIKHDGKWFKADLAPHSASPITPFEGSHYGYLDGDDRTLSNDRVKLRFDNMGIITCVLYKDTGTNYSGEYMNKLTMYSDKELHYNAWDIDPDYIYQPRNNIVLKRVKVIKDGPRIIRQHVYSFNRSNITQNIVLEAGSELIRIDTKVYWEESNVMMRADFRPSVWSDDVNCDIQFGNLTRRTTKHNKIEEAQFEICAHKYINMDMCDGKEGLAILTDSKYGWRVKDGLVSLNLLRSPVYPDKNCDRMEHHFSYCILPHIGVLKDSDVMKAAYGLNNPVEVTATGTCFGTIAETDNRNVIIDTVKRAEDGSGTVVRMFNNTRDVQECNLVCNIPYSEAFETNMLEENAEPTTLQLLLKPFEIKTILFRE